MQRPSRSVRIATNCVSPAPSYRPRAYQQGELDRLCGLYAIVNGVRHTLGPVVRFRGDECRWLFGELIHACMRRRLLSHMLVDGLTQGHVSTVLILGQQLVADQYGFTFSYRRPFARHRPPSRRNFIDIVQRHLEHPAAAAIARFCDHWSVIQRASARSLRLLDSVGYATVRYDRMFIGVPRRTADEDKEWVLSSTLVLLRYLPSADQRHRPRSSLAAGGHRRCSGLNGKVSRHVT